MRKALILVRALPQYRIDFYNRLREELLKKNISLSIIYGKSKSKRALKKDEKDLEWAEYLPNTIFNFGEKELTWQPALRKLSGFDLIIVEFANRNIINYYLMLSKIFSRKKFAFWGHVSNPYLDNKDFRNKFKKLFINQSDWWFAYTENEKNRLKNYNCSESKITVVQNAIDTRSLREIYLSVDKKVVKGLRKDLEISSHHVGIYCGGIYKEKRIGLLIEAARKVREKIPDFHLIIIGAGHDDYIVKEAVLRNRWIHYVGPKFDSERVKYFHLASVFLMTGTLGLAILDSFAMETPMIVTEYQFHSPELSYLKNNINGIICKDDIDIFSQKIARVLMDTSKLNSLREHCILEAEKYTLETMVTNFANGVEKCLDK